MRGRQESFAGYDQNHSATQPQPKDRVKTLNLEMQRKRGKQRSFGVVTLAKPFRRSERLLPISREYPKNLCSLRFLRISRFLALIFILSLVAAVCFGFLFCFFAGVESGRDPGQRLPPHNSRMGNASTKLHEVHRRRHALHELTSLKTPHLRRQAIHLCNVVQP